MVIIAMKIIKKNLSNGKFYKNLNYFYTLDNSNIFLVLLIFIYWAKTHVGFILIRVIFKSKKGTIITQYGR